MPTAREPDSFRVSTCPRRTVVENSSPSRTIASVADAPPAIARRTRSWASSWRSVSSFGFRVSSSVGDIKSLHHRVLRGPGEMQVLGIAPDDNCSPVLSWGDSASRSQQREARSRSLLHESGGILLRGSADRQAIDFDGRYAYAHRNGLS